jgi:hypothetical protein
MGMAYINVKPLNPRHAYLEIKPGFSNHPDGCVSLPRRRAGSVFRFRIPISNAGLPGAFHFGLRQAFPLIGLEDGPDREYEQQQHAHRGHDRGQVIHS